MLPLRTALRTRCSASVPSTVPRPFVVAAAAAAGRSFVALPPRAAKAPPQKKIRSLAEIEADELQVRASALKTGWTQTKEPGEEAEMIIFDRPSNPPPFLVGLAAAAMSASFLAMVYVMRELNQHTAVEELPSQAAEFVPDAPSVTIPTPSASSSLALGRSIESVLPFQLPTVSGNWAYFYILLAMAPPTAVLLYATHSCARIVRYKPSGRLRVYSRLDDAFRLPAGRLVDYGIAEGHAPVGKNRFKHIHLHLPPSGFSVKNVKPGGKLKLTRLVADLEPLDAEELAQAQKQGRRVILDQNLIDVAFGGISVKTKAPTS